MDELAFSNVPNVVRLAADRYGDAGNVPSSGIVQGMAAWKARRAGASK